MVKRLKAFSEEKRVCVCVAFFERHAPRERHKQRSAERDRSREAPRERHTQRSEGIIVD